MATFDAAAIGKQLQDQYDYYLQEANRLGVDRPETWAWNQASRVNGPNGTIYSSLPGTPGTFGVFTPGLQAGDQYAVYIPDGRGGYTQATQAFEDSGMGLLDYASLGALAGITAAAGGSMLGDIGVGASGAGTTDVLPAGGMAATGTTAPWAATEPALGSGMFGTGTADMGALMGTQGGAFGLGSGLAGVTSADLAAAGTGANWLSTAQNLGKLLNATKNGAGSGSSGISAPATSNSGMSGGNAQVQGASLMPKFSSAPPTQTNYWDELGNSQNINKLAQALTAYKGNIYG